MEKKITLSTWYVCKAAVLHLTQQVEKHAVHMIRGADTARDTIQSKNMMYKCFPFFSLRNFV